VAGPLHRDLLLHVTPTDAIMPWVHFNEFNYGY